MLCLEAELDELDAEQAKTEVGAFLLRASRYEFTQPPFCERSSLMARLHAKLKEYDDLLLREHAVMSLAPSTKKAYLAYFNYIWNEKPLAENEWEFIRHKSDLVSLGEQEDSWRGSLVDDVLKLTPTMIRKATSLCLYGTSES